MRALSPRGAVRLAAAGVGLVVTWCALGGARPAERWQPPETYRRWYGEIVTCAGAASAPMDLDGHPFDALAWERMRDSGRVLGRYAPPDTIYLTDRAIGVEWVVKHELLHYLTGIAQDGPTWAVCGVLDQDTWDAYQSRQRPLVPPILRGAGA